VWVAEAKNLPQMECRSVVGSLVENLEAGLVVVLELAERVYH